VIATLPTFYVPLRGETTIHLRATTNVSKDRLVTTFPSIPDAPITKFQFNIKGGKNGIVQATRQFPLKVPLVIRLTGTNEELAVQILTRAGFRALTDMDEAVKQAVVQAKAA